MIAIATKKVAPAATAATQTLKLFQMFKEALRLSSIIARIRALAPTFAAGVALLCILLAAGFATAGNWIPALAFTTVGVMASLVSERWGRR